MVETTARQPCALHHFIDADRLKAVTVEENTSASDDALTSFVFVMSCVRHECIGKWQENMFLNISCQMSSSSKQETGRMTSTAIAPQSIQVSVLSWVPPIVHGLVRDLRVRWALVVV